MDRVKKRWELYNSGCSDQEIAAGSGYLLSTIRAWRCRVGLKSNRAGQQQIERMKHYKQGMNDLEIATALGCKYATISYWRRANKLKKNKGLARSLPEYVNKRPEKERLLIRQYASALIEHAEAYEKKYDSSPTMKDIASHMDAYRDLFGTTMKGVE